MVLMNGIKKFKWIIGTTSIILVAFLAVVMNSDKWGSGAVSAYGKVSQDAIEVSLINLIATPEQYDGKLVRVTGVAKVEFENSGLYLSRDDYKNAITKNAVCLTLDEKLLGTTYENLKKSNGKYVLVEGIFNSKKKGHFDRYSGTIDNITRYELWK